MSVDELRDHWTHAWGPARATLLVSGDVTATRVEAAAHDSFGAWASDARPPARVAGPGAVVR